MFNPKTFRHIAVYGVSLPSFVVSPAVAKATVYMPSQVAARMLGGRPAKNIGRVVDAQVSASGTGESDTSHAA